MYLTSKTLLQLMITTLHVLLQMMVCLSNKLLAAIFLEGADKTRFKGLKEMYRKSYLSKQDIYPTSVEDVLVRLQEWLESDEYLNSSTRNRNEDDGLGGTSFYQGKGRKKDMSKVRCHGCGEIGHFVRDCRNQGRTQIPVGTSNAQIEGEADEHSVRSDPGGIAWNAVQPVRGSAWRAGGRRF